MICAVRFLSLSMSMWSMHQVIYILESFQSCAYLTFNASFLGPLAFNVFLDRNCFVGFSTSIIICVCFAIASDAVNAHKKQLIETIANDDRYLYYVPQIVYRMLVVIVLSEWQRGNVGTKQQFFDSLFRRSGWGCYINHKSNQRNRHWWSPRQLRVGYTCMARPNTATARNWYVTKENWKSEEIATQGKADETKYARGRMWT